MRRHAQALLRTMALVLAALAEAVATVAGAMSLILVYGLGMVFLLTPVVRMHRVLTGLARSRAWAWSGIRVPEPYDPPPPPPVLQPDGWYRSERTLYKTPTVPAWNMRWKWMFADPATWRDMLWLALDPFVSGVLGLLPLLLIGCGVATPFLWHPFAAPLGLAVAAAGVLAAPRLLQAHARWTVLLLAPTARTLLAGTMRHLARTRTEAIDSQSAELQRIERELHDGAQARLIAMGMTLGAAEGLVRDDPAAAKVLLARAREASATALGELRRVVRGIHPPVLAERGLGDAVRALALDSPIQVTVEVDLPVRPEPPVESAAFFAVSELLTDAAGQPGAERVLIDISHQGAALRVTITGDGDAEPSEEVRHGVERRLASFDGVLAVSGVPGSPTTLTLDLPYALTHTITDKAPKMPGWKVFLVVFGWSLGWLPLFPQGLVSMVFKLSGTEERAWFLALHVPEPFQWPVIVFMICLGAVMIGMAATIPLRHSRERWLAEATPHRLWLER
ncbi:histidine kinase [Streptosporangium soli]|nr:histidine kinase [Streptosporangium sp. KLBMP 9127]